MFFTDHLPPHFHAVYAEYVAMFNIETLEVVEGDLPRKAVALVREWAAEHQDELRAMWEKKIFHKLPPLR